MDNQENIVITPTTPSQTPLARSYTEITHTVQNLNTVRHLKNLISGRCGLLTNTHSYLYQSLISRTQNSSLSNTLSQLVNQSLLHTKLLSSAIISFGGNPRFNNSQGSFWTTRNVCYLTSPSQFLNCNIQRERIAINKIERVILQTQNQSLHLLLQEIIADKNNNITLLNSILSSL